MQTFISKVYYNMYILGSNVRVIGEFLFWQQIVWGERNIP